MGLIVGTDGKVWPLECTARLGWPIFYMQSFLHRQPMADFFADLLAGKDTLRARTEHCCGIVVGIKPFPYESYADPDLCEGYPILGLTQESMDHVRLGQVRSGKALVGDKLVERDVFVTAGPYVCCVVDKGATVRIAAERALQHIKPLRIPNSPLYRNDIGCDLGGVLKKLKSHGFCEEWENGE